MNVGRMFVDDRRFDVLTKALADSSSRRSVIKGFLGLGGALTATTLLGRTRVDAARRPTPAPKPVTCPGQQIWDDAQCVCPSGYGCGPDCCTTIEQCCDNACCPDDAVCVAEERCCPAAQACPNAPDGPCCPDGLLCCPGGDSCYDPNGGCCVDTDCAGDFCNAGVCRDNWCVLESFADGVDCGDCLACQDGMCTSTCAEGELCCADDDRCIDPTSGGCCHDVDCPTVDCAPGVCIDHQCGTGEPVYCQTDDGPVCCSEGTRCVAVANETGGTSEICCTDESAACLTLVGGVPTAVCCESGTQCYEAVNNEGISYGVCCANAEAACFNYEGNTPVAFCCEGGLQCSVATEFFGNLPLGMCCAPGTTACMTSEGPVCCESGTQCYEVDNILGTSYGVCCSSPEAACNVVIDGQPTGICCESGSSCHIVGSLGGVVAIGICCADGLDACTTTGGVICCESGAQCVPLLPTTSGPIGTCCANPADACLTMTDGDLQGVCCAAGTQCYEVYNEVSLGLEFSLGACCANEADACYTGTSSVCCGANQVCDPGNGCVPISP